MFFSEPFQGGISEKRGSLGRDKLKGRSKLRKDISSNISEAEGSLPDVVDLLQLGPDTCYSSPVILMLSDGLLLPKGLQTLREQMQSAVKDIPVQLI